jgi:hypothetical protein
VDSFLIFLSLMIFSFAGYILWPSRFNVVSHLSVGGSFIAIFVPTLILHIDERYPTVVDLYLEVLMVGALCYLPAAILGFWSARRVQTKFSFDRLDECVYEGRTIRLTQRLLIFAIAGLAVSYLVMGFVPMFAREPIAAKLFRAQYQEPYRRVAVLFRASFYILATIMPIACIIWYKYRSRFFLYAILCALGLMVISLVRAGAFGGIVFAFAIIMAFKSRTHFALLMISMIAVFILSSFFYYIIGVRSFTGNENYWEVLAQGSSDIEDQLQFLVRFQENPVYTYGRTIYGGLIPGHYKWNPSVYTLSIIAPNEDINIVGSGGIRLPLPLWGYVSFQWLGVVVFSVSTGFLAGYFLRVLKNWFEKFPSILIRTVCVVVFGTLFGTIIGFSQLNMFNIPPLLICLMYIYRFKWQ